MRHIDQLYKVFSVEPIKDWAIIDDLCRTRRTTLAHVWGTLVPQWMIYLSLQDTDQWATYSDTEKAIRYVEACVVDKHQ